MMIENCHFQRHEFDLIIHSQCQCVPWLMARWIRLCFTLRYDGVNFMHCSLLLYLCLLRIHADLSGICVVFFLLLFVLKMSFLNFKKEFKKYRAYQSRLTAHKSPIRIIMTFYVHTNDLQWMSELCTWCTSGIQRRITKGDSLIHHTSYNTTDHHVQGNLSFRLSLFPHSMERTQKVLLPSINIENHCTNWTQRTINYYFNWGARTR